MNTIFKNYCSPAWLSLIEHHQKKIKFPAKSVIFEEGNEVLGFYTIIRGKVKVVSNEQEEKQRLVRVASDGDILGHRGFFGNWKYPVSAITLTATEVSFLPTHIFIDVVKSNPELSFQLITFFAEELRNSEERIAPRPIKNKLCAAILMNLNAFGFDENNPKKLAYTLSRQEYAAYIGTTYETIIRELKLLNIEGVIETEGKTLLIKNKKTLEKLAAM